MCDLHMCMIWASFNGGCTIGSSRTLHAFNEMTRSSFTRWGTRRFAASIPWSTQFPWQTATELFHVTPSYLLHPFIHVLSIIHSVKIDLHGILFLKFCYYYFLIVFLNPLKATANLRAALLKACDKVRLAFWLQENKDTLGCGYIKKRRHLYMRCRYRYFVFI